MQEKPLETVRSLAERLQVSPRRILREVLAGRLTYVNIAGHIRFRECDVAAWIDDTQAAPPLRAVGTSRGGSRGS